MKRSTRSLPVFGAAFLLTGAALLTAGAVQAQCPADVTGNGVVDEAGDLTLIILDYGCTGACSGDVNGNGFTGENDFTAAQSNLGTCFALEDVNRDGSVSITDLLDITGHDGETEACAFDVDNSGTVDIADALIVSSSIEGSPDALPAGEADVNGDLDEDLDDVLDTFVAGGGICRYDIDGDGTVEGLPGEDDFELICAATGIC